ncbi:MAG: hypothetical protein ABID71_04910 [Chloroflexota bacterium]
MQQVANKLELSALNWRIAEAYLDDAAANLHVAVMELEGCLDRLAEIRKGEAGLSMTDGWKQPLVVLSPAPGGISRFPRN